MRLQWVPAHVGVKENELADYTAKLAAVSDNVLDFILDHVEYLFKFKISCIKINKLLTCVKKSQNIKAFGIG